MLASGLKCLTSIPLQSFLHEPRCPEEDSHGFPSEPMTLVTLGNGLQEYKSCIFFPIGLMVKPVWQEEPAEY